MKHRTHIALLITLLFSGVYAQKDSAAPKVADTVTYGALHAEDGHWCIGLGAQVGISDWGAHVRFLHRDIWGLDVRGFYNWDQMGSGFTGLAMFKIPLDAPIRPYVALGAGAYWASIDTILQIDYGLNGGATTAYRYTEDFVMPHYMGLVGAEWRFGKNERHALGLEVGYQFGEKSYEYSYTPLGDTGVLIEQIPYAVKPFEVNLLYTYYFCREKDRDGDGIKDKKDQCPDFAGVVEYGGCPNPDSDGDRVLDPWVTEQNMLSTFASVGTGYDSCVHEVGPVKNYGCPIVDRDGDGVLDSVDLCPDLPGELQFFGCPDPDSDKDGICSPWVTEMALSAKFVSHCVLSDACPNEPETENGYKDNDGCPDERPMAREITRDPVVLDGVVFATGKSILRPESYEVLDKVAASLEAWAEINIEIHGHTDNVGKPAANMTLSQNRAAAVKAYLVSKGVAEERMVTKGFGQEQPIADNKTPEGRQQNRRVTMERSN